MDDALAYEILRLPQRRVYLRRLGRARRRVRWPSRCKPGWPARSPPRRPEMRERRGPVRARGDRSSDQRRLPLGRPPPRLAGRGRLPPERVPGRGGAEPASAGVSASPTAVAGAALVGRPPARAAGPPTATSSRLASAAFLAAERLASTRWLCATSRGSRIFSSVSTGVAKKIDEYTAKPIPKNSTRPRSFSVPALSRPAPMKSRPPTGRSATRPVLIDRISVWLTARLAASA